MYTGLAAAYVGAALWVGTWWPLIIAPLPVLATHRWVIVPEEEYLKRRFGAEYERYQSQVRRNFAALRQPAQIVQPAENPARSCVQSHSRRR